ncbi:MAG: PASTA domain-containing protein [Gracilibacteraceae bacterium]|jgi:cell division protein FtsI/penicillin-binding protein 2|nr:PASTA domain-containing protein [Gracilibacteraceae bacterium]
MSGQGRERSKPSRARERFVHCLIALIFALVVGRLFYLQVIDGKNIRQRAEELRRMSQIAIVGRGAVVDAQNNILAKSIRSYDVFADPEFMRDYLNGDFNNRGLTVEGLARALASILDAEETALLAKLNSDGKYVLLARQIPTEISEKLSHADKTLLGMRIEGTESEIFNLLNIGVGVTDSYKRHYPMGSLGAGVVGFVKDDGNGAAGVEAYYNGILNGRAGPDSDLPPVNGSYSIRLTLDATIQHLLEKELDAALAECNPTRACVAALDPMSGKILGMASRPTFDPAEFAGTDPENYRNLPTNMTYEPGSTFKIITASMAIEEQLVARDRLFSDPGFLTIGPDTIRNWDSAITAHGDITLARAMMDSSNVVFGQVGMLIGRDLFNLYLRGFGFGEQTGVDLGGEEQGMLVKYDNIRNIEMATMAFGQANLVTPLQLLSAACAVVNGGYLYQPYILDAVLDGEGRALRRTEPEVKRQVISAATAQEVTGILEQVVENGTGSRVKIPGIRVAGKTGTAQKVDPLTGQYSDTDFVVSFIAFAPIENPRIAVLFVIDTPKGVKPQGGTLAGPRVKNILEGALQYYGIPVDGKTPDDLSEWRSTEVRETAPAETEPLALPGEGEVAVPSLIGLTMKQAGEALAAAELRYQFRGSGLAVEQFPAAGTVVNRGDTVEVAFGQ